MTSPKTPSQKNKIVHRLISLQILIVLIAWMGFACLPSAVKQIYVAPNGKDHQTGTFDNPLATLNGARNAIRKMKQTGKLPEGGVEVLVRGGNYTMDKTFELNADDSGTDSAPIIYRNYQNEAVYLQGGRNIDTHEAKKVTEKSVLDRLPENALDKVYELDLPSIGISSYGRMHQYGFSLPIQPYPLELYINGKPQRLARWPNEGTVEIGKVIDPGSHPRRGDFSNRGGQFHYDYDRADRWNEAEDIWLQGIFSHGYADDNLLVENIDRNKKIIKVAQPHMYTIRSSKEDSGGKHLRGYFVYNLLEEIDMPGEYFLDRQKGKLYFWPPNPIQDCEIAVSIMEDPLIALEDASHITLSGFTLEYSRGMGIYLEEGEKNIITQCTFRNLGLMGIMMGKGVIGSTGPVHEFTGKEVARQVGNLKAHAYQNTVWNRKAGYGHRIEGCQFYQLGSGGIILDGGDRKTLTPGSNEVVNCEFHHFNRWNKTYAPAVEIRGVGNRIRHNYIHHAPHTVILLSGNDHLIEYNEIAYVCEKSDDMGAIYMGRNPSQQGNMIRYNYFHDFEREESRVTAIYFDDGENGGKVFGNVFYRVGSPRFGAIFVHGGHDHLFENNIFIDCMRALGNAPWDDARWHRMMEEKLWQDRLKKSLDISKPPYAEKYPNLVHSLEKKERVNRAVKNLVVQCETFSVPQYELSDNWITNEDPGFVAPEKGNFTLKSDAKVFEVIPDFQPIPFDSIGLLTENKNMEDEKATPIERSIRKIK